MWRSVVPLLLSACAPENQLDIRREPPEVAITAPLDGSFLVQDQGTIALLGTVSDLPDPAETLLVGWTLGDVVLPSFAPDSTGAVASFLDVGTLALGPHTITLFVTDSDDNMRSATVTVEVIAPAAPPIVEITAPADGSEYGLGDPITFTGTAVDANDDVGDLTLAWASSLQGPLPGATSGGGLSFLTIDTLISGDHTIVFSATDLDGEIGSDAIVVHVGPPPDPPPDEPEPGEVIFSELMINPSLDDEVAEWVELYNVGDAWLDIGGYSFHDLDFDEYTLQGTILVPPRGYAVLCAHLDPEVNGGVECDGWFERLTSGGLALGNTTDEVVLSKADGTEIDRLEYGAPWVTEGAAIGLDPAHLTGTENDEIANWCFQTTPMSGGDKGTPGAENNPCE